MKKGIIIILLALLTAGFAYAASQETVHTIQLPNIPTELKAGEGKDRMALCGICHSLDYITMQPEFSRTQWTAEVNKMIKVMGAPVNEDDAKIIINYLATQYGTGK